jgi:hypothetical protein
VNRLTACAVRLCAAGLLAASVTAQQPVPPGKSDVPTARATTAVLAAEALEKAREALRKADAVWNWSRRLLAERRLAGNSTHPWDRAGSVGSGGWE